MNIKINDSIINDPKIGMMPDRTFRRAMQLLVIADKKGIIPNANELAWILRTTEKDIENNLKDLMKFDFIEAYNNGLYEALGIDKTNKYIIKSFNNYIENSDERHETSRDESDETSQKSSHKLSDAERARRYRASRKASREISDETTQNITQKEKESSKEKEIINNNINNNQELSLENNKYIPENNNNLNNLKNIQNESEKSDKSSQTSRDEITIETFKWAKEEQERAYLFWKMSGVLPLKNEYGRWIKDLRQFTEAEISFDFMVAAIGVMRKENLRIKAPGSVFGIARDLKAKAGIQKYGAPETNEDYLSDIEWEGKDE